MRLLMLLLTIIFSYTIGISQSETEEYTAKYLIPYNDHGQWGYSDTLGSIKITAAYKTVGLFQERRLNVNNVWYSHVKTNYGNNILFPNGELMFPFDVHLEQVSKIGIRNMAEYTFLVSRDGQFGLFAYGIGMVVPTEYDSTKLFAGVFFMKKSGQKSYARFETKKQKIISTDIVSMEPIYNWTDQGSLVTIFLAKRKNGKYYTINSGVFTPISKEEGNRFIENKEDFLLEEVDDDDWAIAHVSHEIKLKDTPLVVQETAEEVLIGYDFNWNRKMSPQAGFTQLYIAKRGEQKGILNEKGEEFSPFQYDNIIFNVGDNQIKYVKNGKIGCRVLFSPYPTIEPKYDLLAPAYYFYVSKKWSFILFRAKTKGQDVFVGVNGVEFFDLD